MAFGRMTYPLKSHSQADNASAMVLSIWNTGKDENRTMRPTTINRQLPCDCIRCLLTPLSFCRFQKAASYHCLRLCLLMHWQGTCAPEESLILTLQRATQGMFASSIVDGMVSSVCLMLIHHPTTSRDFPPTSTTLQKVASTFRHTVRHFQRSSATSCSRIW